jgi:hypothetical protein
MSDAKGNLSLELSYKSDLGASAFQMMRNLSAHPKVIPQARPIPIRPSATPSGLAVGSYAPAVDGIMMSTGENQVERYRVSCELMKNHKLATSISPTKNISVIEVS